MYNHAHLKPTKLINIPTIKYLKKIIIPYSIKIKAKIPLKYSTLKPETNSDLLSIKSIGLRFNSVNTLTKNTKNNGFNINPYHIYTCHFIKSKKEYLSLKIINTKKIIINLTSYDKVCEIARTASIKEYIKN